MPTVNQIAQRADWEAARTAHHERFDATVGPFLRGRDEGRSHPVFDFLFTYYSFRAGQLRRWTPGVGTRLGGVCATDGFSAPWRVEGEAGEAWLDPSRFPAHRVESVRWTRELLAGMETRPPVWGCLGLHEWAMLYRTTAPRHADLALRLSPQGIAAVVEDHSLCCTHFDAYRFFTPAAVPRNSLALTRGQRMAREQRGCIHATMDLYKWCYKFYPWLSSRLMMDAFDLAWEARVLDMQASPYDLREFGLDPVCIETEAGRGEYRGRQRALAEAAVPLRRRVIEALEGLLGAIEPGCGDGGSTGG